MDGLLSVLRMLADGVRGPLVHELIDKLEAAGKAPAAAPRAPAAPPAALQFQAPEAPANDGGSK